MANLGMSRSISGLRGVLARGPSGLCERNGDAHVEFEESELFEYTSG